MHLGRCVTCDMLDLPEMGINNQQAKQQSLSFCICHQYRSKNFDIFAFAFMKSLAFVLETLDSAGYDHRVFSQGHRAENKKYMCPLELGCRRSFMHKRRVCNSELRPRDSRCPSRTRHFPYFLTIRRTKPNPHEVCDLMGLMIALERIDSNPY